MCCSCWAALAELCAKCNCSRVVFHAPLRGSLLSDNHYSPNQQNQDVMEMWGGMAEGRFRASVLAYQAVMRADLFLWLYVPTLRLSLTIFCNSTYSIRQ